MQFLEIIPALIKNRWDRWNRWGNAYPCRFQPSHHYKKQVGQGGTNGDEAAPRGAALSHLFHLEKLRWDTATPHRCTLPHLSHLSHHKKVKFLTHRGRKST